jgi:hypothetical protein
MHCARLGFQGLELLNNRRLTLPIADEPGDWLRAVRRGDVPFDEWWERVLRLDSMLEDKLSDDSIPAQCDGAVIEAWMVATHLAFWTR